MKIVKLRVSEKKLKAKITPPASKSESNRALIMNALSGNQIKLKNISEARDTKTMQTLLSSDLHELNVLDAGTTMRFLTAYYSIKGDNRILTGTPRMQERPLGILVDALKELGAEITYLKKEGYPPIEINGFKYKGGNEVKMKGDVSSQYISALLMVSPYLPDGLDLTLEGNIGSRPYILMTLELMKLFGATYEWEGNKIKIYNKPYKSQEYSIESDWSAASYWYSIVALAQSGTEIFLNGLKKESLQGDMVISHIMESLGVHSEFNKEGVLLTKKESVSEFDFDFRHCPDLAQTVFVICAAKKIRFKASGLESLRIKETDRISALQNELIKIGSEIIEKDGQWELVNGSYTVEGIEFETYDDHRMAMAFAPLAILGTIEMENPEVVNKSYPGFWNDLKKAGFDVKII